MKELQSCAVTTNLLNQRLKFRLQLLIWTLCFAWKPLRRRLPSDAPLGGIVFEGELHTAELPPPTKDSSSEPLLVTEGLSELLQASAAAFLLALVLHGLTNNKLNQFLWAGAGHFCLSFHNS